MVCQKPKTYWTTQTAERMFQMAWARCSTCLLVCVYAGGENPLSGGENPHGSDSPEQPHSGILGGSCSRSRLDVCWLRNQYSAHVGSLGTRHHINVSKNAFALLRQVYPSKYIIPQETENQV